MARIVYPVLLVFLACSSTTKSGMPILPQGQHASKGKYSEMVWVDRQYIAENPIRSLYLAEIDVKSIKNSTSISRNECKACLANAILKSTYCSGLISDMVDSTNLTATFTFAKLTALDAGSADWGADFDLRTPRVQIQLVVTDRDGRKIVVASDSESRVGLSNFRSTYGDANPDIVKELIKDVAEHLLRELDETIAGTSTNARH
jgi:hypothetical protein